MAAIVLAACGFVGAKFLCHGGGGAQVPSGPAGGAAQRAASPAPPAPASAPDAPAAEVSPDASAADLKQAAIRVIRGLMAEFPASSDPWVMMGAFYSRLEESNEAEKWWGECLRRDPTRADVCLILAQQAAGRGERDKADALLRQAKGLNPELHGLFADYAGALLAMDRADDAVAVLEKGLAATPDDACALVLLGQARLRQKEYEKAATSFQRAVDMEWPDSFAYFGLGTAYARSGRKDKAEEYLAKFQALRDQEDATQVERRKSATDRLWVSQVFADTLTEAGILYQSKGRLAKAEACFRRAAVFDPSDVFWREKLANLLEAAGRRREALDLIEQLRGLAPRNSTHQVRAGVLLAELKQPDAAEAAFRKAIELAPKKPDGYRFLTRLLLARKQGFPEAKAAAGNLVALEPTVPNYAMLAEACDRSGDLAGARAALERALALEPNNGKLKALHKALQDRK